MLLSLALTACQTTDGGETKPASGLLFCDVMSPFRWSSRDTRETQDQATEINNMGRKACGWKPWTSKLPGGVSASST